MKNARRTKSTKPVLALSSLTIRREGQVDWKVSGLNHCGPASELRDGVMPVKYTALVICKPHLDERGFLFDQAALDKYVRHLAKQDTTLSCEALAIWVCDQLLEKIAVDVPSCDIMGIKLTLSPSPFAASITVEYGEVK